MSENTSAIDYTPLNVTISEVRDAIPSHLFERNTWKSLVYLGRDLLQAALLFVVMLWLESMVASKLADENLKMVAQTGLVALQGLAFTGLWVIGHECGHGAFSPYSWVNDSIGLIIHSALWTPYFSWKISHHRHHANHGSMEKDEVYVPKTRRDLGIPNETPGEKINYAEYLSDTPIYNLFMLIMQQLFAFPAYLLFNVSGQKSYPRGTNHFNPKSVLFRDSQFAAVIVSNLALSAATMVTMSAIRTYGLWPVMKYYGVPWFGVSHWFVMITYLHHTAADVPHFQRGSWTYARGAAATVDRNFLGWQGRYFLHDVAHYHVIHHFFPKMSWYNGEEATRHLRRVLGAHYLYSDEPVFAALWKSYNECQFVDDDVDILFYKNQKGEFALLNSKNSKAN
ncbi:delta-12 fatty acid desaturase [Moniliophthora roreri]|nr:delta-12 fatty acid desaturase [Moniliophthora roreri]